MAYSIVDNRVLLPMKRYRQRDSECAIAAASTLAHYFDSNFVYKEVRKLVNEEDRKKGLYTPEQALLLNKLGFENVVIVTHDLDIFDFGWNRLTRNGMIKRLRKSRDYHRDKDEEQARLTQAYIKWLRLEKYDNKIIVDSDLPKYIKRQLNAGRPVSASFNFTSMWKCTKGSMARNGDIKESPLEHAIVLRGYDDKGVFVVDSDSYRHKNGFYKLKWSDFLANGPAELILV